MRILLGSALAFLLVSGVADARENQKVYRWVDKDGNVHFGDSVPAEYAEMEKQVLNEHGVTVDRLRGKKTAEEIAEEERQAKLAEEQEMRRRADQALLATYMTIDEILMHRDRRVELFQAQARVTELYLRNLQRRLQALLDEAQGFQPYSSDPEAPMIGADLTDEIAETKETIARHEGNLDRFKVNEQEIIERFESDMMRFKHLKGDDTQASADAGGTSGSK